MKKIISALLCLMIVLSSISCMGTFVASAISVTPVAGDVNGDGEFNNKDLTRLMKYLAGEDVEVSWVAIDPNGDGSTNNKDLTRIMRVRAGDDLPIILVGCPHERTAVAAKEATCKEPGNIAYWICTECNKYYSDEKGVMEVTMDEIVIPKSETHLDIVIIPGKAATTTETGLTEGKICNTCGTITVEQQIIPISEYEIVYDISDGDTYLDNLYANGGINNPNPASYNPETGVANLENITDVAGYTFDGWYTSFGANGKLVESIEAGRTGKITLYAKWTKKAQKAYFESDLVQPTKTSMEYYIDEGSDLFEVLTAPDGYTFVGWSDGNGKIHKKVPVGTPGPVTYTANWISERNQAVANKNIGEPIVYEDESVILYTYEIGQIKNVPLYTMVDFGYLNAGGVDKTVTVTYETSVSETLMEEYASTVSTATTESFGWSLSSGWSETTSVDETWAEQNGLTVEEAERICKNESNEYYASSGSSGTDTTVIADSTDTYDLHTKTKNKKTYNVKDKETRQDFSAGLNANYTVGAGVKLPVDGVEIGAEKKLSIGADLKYSNGVTTNTKTGTEKEVKDEFQNGTVGNHSETQTSQSSWNSESGYRTASSLSQENSITKAMSKVVSNQTSYGQSYINSEDETVSQGIEGTTANTEEYGSSVTYAKTESKTVTETFTTSCAVTGYHRWIMAGTAHVFAVVGYDIATKSYFVTSFSIMDDEIYRYEDYSLSSPKYDDQQNGVIPFVAPDDIVQYVGERTFASEGLQVSKDGIVTGYTGEDTFVVIPEYFVQKNSYDGNTSVIKITGIAANAFDANRDEITGVILSDFIADIPDGCFQDCTNLISIDGKGVTSIGDNAFAGCDKLKVCTLDDNVVVLGENAFGGLDSLSVKAANKAVAEKVIASGAKEIVLTISDKCEDLKDIELVIPSTVTKFTFNGSGKTFENVIVKSDAQETIINRADFVSTGDAPLRISSQNVTLSETTAVAPSFALVLTNENTDLSLFGESYIGNSDKNTVLCKNLILDTVDNNYYSVLHVSGNVLVCGDIENSAAYLTVENGEIIVIDVNDFDKYVKGTVVISFDANGGTMEETTITGIIGTAVGELPVPTRENCTFDGWYTEDGKKITSDTVIDFYENITLKAHWSSGWILASELPEDGVVSSEKWTYDKKTDITSSNKSESGYILYNTTSKWSDWGAWSDYSRTQYTASDSRQVQSKTVTDSNAYTNYNYYYYRYWNSSAGTYYYTYSSSMGGTKYTKTLTSPMDYYNTYSGHDAYKKSGGGYYNFSGEIWYLESKQSVPAVTHTEYRYRDRHLIYTYYHTKTESLESATEITTSDAGTNETISNIQKWVKYTVQ